MLIVRAGRVKFCNFVNIEMQNGIKLETVLRADFEKNVLTRLNQEPEREV